VKADGRQVEQVFMNVISNAVAAMENGGVLTIAAYRSDGSVKITFKDTGVGIPRQNMDKIFEPFFTTKDVGKGTGLGLSVSYGIIKKFGGEIEVESRTREESSQPGTMFTISLPVLDLNGRDEKS
jgi:signal transduction histidine kinase